MMLVHFLYRASHALGLDEARRFELISLVVELAVLWVIAYETFWRPWRVRGWVKQVYKSFAEGLAIRRRVPRTGADPAASQNWRAQADRWYGETKTMLKKHSVQSAAAFVWDPAQPTLQFGGIDPECEGHLRGLLAALSNLKDIMEKPDIYF